LKVTPTPLPGVLLVEPRVIGDERGFFLETWKAEPFAAAGIAGPFVQDNHSRSSRGVLRGLHYQLKYPQGKLVRATSGEIFDVAVDLRMDSTNFGRWTGATLSAENRRQLWIPEGFGHGFLVTSDSAEVLYKATNYWYPAYERSVLWDDPELGIEWPLEQMPRLAAKDAAAHLLSDAELF